MHHRAALVEHQGGAEVVFRPFDERRDGIHGLGAHERGHSRRVSGIERLHEHVDAAAAGQPDFPGGLVGDAVMDQLATPGLQGLDAGLERRALDAAAADGSRHAAGRCDGHLGPRPTWT